MSLAVRIARLVDRAFDAVRDRRAFAVTEADGTDEDFERLRAAKYALLVTFRRNGEPVPSPVWVAQDEQGVLYVKTAEHAGKVKRLRRDPRVLVAPATMRGKPIGPVIEGTGRLLAEDEWVRAEEALAGAYGMGRRISERLLGQEVTAAYIAITPGRSPSGPPGRGRDG